MGNELDKTNKNDSVNHPNHYKLEGLNVEVKDVIKSVLGDNTKYFYLGNVIKYILRAHKKNGLEDYKKCQLYLEWFLSEEELSDEQTKKLGGFLWDAKLIDEMMTGI